MTSEVCMKKTLICRHTYVPTQPRIILGCGPNANLMSTNTHGTQQREKDMEQGEASGYYAWTEVLSPCILKCGLGLVTDTTWTTKCLFNWPEWNKVQMALIDNIHLRNTSNLSFSPSVTPLSCSHTFFSSVLYSLTLLNSCTVLPFSHHTLNVHHFYTETMISYPSSFLISLTTPFIPLSFPSFHTSIEYLQDLKCLFYWNTQNVEY